MVYRYFTNNLDCLCYVLKRDNKFYYVDDTKGYFYEITQQQADELEDE